MNTTEPTPEGSKGVELFVRCDCGCHGTPGMMHFQACCEGGNGRKPGFTRAYEVEWEIADLKAALAELIKPAEHCLVFEDKILSTKVKKYKSAIERAKSKL